MCPEADIFGVIGFYTLFHDEPTGRRIIRVCTDPTCALAGADELLHDTCARLGIREGETSGNDEYTVGAFALPGLVRLCARPPLVSACGQPDVALPHVSVDGLLGEWHGEVL